MVEHPDEEVLGRISIRRLRDQQIESLYDALLHPAEGQGLAPKTVCEIRDPRGIVGGNNRRKGA